VDRGVIILGGPIGGGDGDDLALLALEAAVRSACLPRTNPAPPGLLAN
jgi:hypothetical protein